MIGRLTKGFEDYVPFLLRVTLSLIFVTQGALILFGFHPKYGGFHKFAAHIAGLGFRPEALWAGLAIGAQFLGGVFLLMGFMTRYAAAGIATLMIVAVFWEMWHRSWWDLQLPFVLLVMAISLTILGSGKKLAMDVKTGQQDRV